VPTATDNFNRASLGTNWTNSLHSLVTNASTDVKGNTAAADNAAWWNADSFASNHYSEAKISNKAADGGPVTRHQSGSVSFYLFDCATSSVSGNCGIYRCDSSAFTLLGASFNSNANSVGDAFRLDSTGSTHSAIIRGSTITTRTDATYTGGAPGLHCFDTSIRWDDWTGSDGITGTPVGQIVNLSQAVKGAATF
jgi:hypothetical protein